MNINLNSRWIITISLSYIYIPVFIFLLGFTKLWIALVVMVTMGVFIAGLYKDYSDTVQNKDEISINVFLLLAIMILMAAVCIVLGFGEVYEQAQDWWKHNAIINDLTDYTWPVYYRYPEESMLTYYIGQYLVPALIGKMVVSKDVSHTFMGIWGYIGVLLVYLNLIRLSRSKTILQQIRTLIILFFFCGALIVAQNLVGLIYRDEYSGAGSYHWIYINNLLLQYRSNLVMLRWVFPQTIVPWLIAMLFVENKYKIKHYVLLISPILLFGTFSTIFFAYAAFIIAVYSLFADKDKKHTLKQIFSYSNIFVFLTLGTVFIVYYLGYLKGEKPEGLGFSFANINIHYLPVYILFCLFMFGIYAACIYKEYKMDIMYYIIVSALILIPLFKMGLYNDWVMCTSIPPLFILMLYVINMLNSKTNSFEYGVRWMLIVITLFVGAWYPVCEVADVINIHNKDEIANTTDYSLSGVGNRESDSEQKDIIYNYYSYDLQDNLFYKYFVRTK